MKEQLDKQEKLILKELIKNPRISDNQISKNTKIPVKTCNRKRKILEKENLIHYMVHLDNSRTGTGVFPTKHMYIVQFKKGITRAQFMNYAKKIDFINLFLKHTSDSFLAESNGCLQLILFIESYKDTDIIEIFNADYFTHLEAVFGKQCISKVQVMTINSQLQGFHNYFPHINMKEGKIKPSWNNIVVY